MTFEQWKTEALKRGCIITRTANRYFWVATKDGVNYGTYDTHRGVGALQQGLL